MNGEVMSLRKFSEAYGETADTLLVYITIVKALFRHKDLIKIIKVIVQLVLNKHLCK